MNERLRLLAMHLPQFHPIPENDAAWGRGFTEWTNVTKARPAFRGHYQPHLPTDLGFYDLRLPEAREAQADLAGEYGIFGFCYYHYWSLGRRLLERPVNDIIESGRPDFPFCLCWANEHWTRRWDGQDTDIIRRQDYSHADDLAHIQWLCHHPFQDRRYVRIDGKPVFLVYAALRLPDVRRTLAIWREEARRQGIGELYLCRMETFVQEKGDPAALGFDAAVEFQPDWKNLGPRLRQGRVWDLLRRVGLSSRMYGDNWVFAYEDIVSRMLRKEAPAYKRFPCVNPSWDNSSRKSRGGVIIHGSTPTLYESWATEVFRRFTPYSAGENLAFVCAWNEWAEGNHLEPDRQWGRAYLEATRRALGISPRPAAVADAVAVPAATSDAGAATPSSTGPERVATAPAGQPESWERPGNDVDTLVRHLANLSSSKADTRLAEGEFLQTLADRQVLLYLYNLATLVERRNDPSWAAAIFDVLGDWAAKPRPDLAGKSHYRAALLATDTAHKRRRLVRCLDLCPEHRAAQQLLLALDAEVTATVSSPPAGP